MLRIKRLVFMVVPREGFDASVIAPALCAEPNIPPSFNSGADGPIMHDRFAVGKRVLSLYHKGIGTTALAERAEIEAFFPPSAKFRAFRGQS